MTTLQAASKAAMTDDGWRVQRDRNPLRFALSASPWRSARYLISYLAVSWVLAGLAFGAASAAGMLAITVLAVPMLVAAAAVVHWCAGVERLMLRHVLSARVRPSYRQAPAPGRWARGRAAWQDPATWRELGYLVGLWAPLAILDTIVLSIWLTFVAGITLPIWYWAPRGNDMVGYVRGTQAHGVALGYFPHGPTGHGAIGLYVDTLPKALLAAAVFVTLFLLFNYVLVATARMHGRVARAMLRPPADPLSEARHVLTEPGPLGPLSPTGN